MNESVFNIFFKIFINYIYIFYSNKNFIFFLNVSFVNAFSHKYIYYKKLYNIDYLSNTSLIDINFIC